MESKWATYSKINKSSYERDVFMKFMRTLKNIGIIDGLIMSPISSWNGVSFHIRVEIYCAK